MVSVLPEAPAAFRSALTSPPWLIDWIASCSDTEPSAAESAAAVVTSMVAGTRRSPGCSMTGRNQRQESLAVGLALRGGRADRKGQRMGSIPRVRSGPASATAELPFRNHLRGSGPAGCGESFRNKPSYGICGVGTIQVGKPQTGDGGPRQPEAARAPADAEDP